MSNRKNPHAVALGRRGGSKRAEHPERTQLARNAGLASMRVARRAGNGQFLPRQSVVSNNETNTVQKLETSQPAYIKKVAR